MPTEEKKEKKEKKDTDEKDDEKEQGLEIDFQIFEQQIDDEIDRLFVPFGSPAEEPKDIAAKIEAAQPAAEQAIPAPAVSDSVVLKAPVSPGGEEKSPAKPRAMKDEPQSTVAPAAARERIERAAKAAPSDARSEIAGLAESFSVAYLSLDWDFSLENLAKLDHALSKLAPYCQGAPETRSLYTILKVSLAQLNDEPETLSPGITELIRDTQELLKDLVLSGESPGPAQKAQFKGLIGRARTMRDGGLLGGKKPRKEVPEDRRPAVEAAGREIGGAASPAAAVGAASGQSVGDPRDWMSALRSRSSEAARGLQDESRRIHQIEQVLGKTAALALVVARLAKIRSALEGHALSLQESDLEWESRLQRLGDLEANIEVLSTKSLEPVSPETLAAPAVERMEIAPEEIAHEEIAHEEIAPEQAEPATIQADVCSYRMSGRRFAVLSSHVVKTVQVSSKKANKIRDRGYATLADFRPFLRSVKTGVMGSWSDLSAQRLKSFQFLPLPYRLLRAPTPPSIAGTAILVSNGDSHGIIFAESDGVKCGQEAIKGVDGQRGIMGVIELGAALPMEVLNIDEILRDFHESPGGEV
jgi:hypothetical protein